jgi:hypothetical protein
VAKFGKCPNLSRFFDRVHNAVSHKHLNFGLDTDSRILADVTATLKDCLPGKPFDWEISMTAEDLEKT